MQNIPHCIQGVIEEQSLIIFTQLLFIHQNFSATNKFYEREKERKVRVRGRERERVSVRACVHVFNFN